MKNASNFLRVRRPSGIFLNMLKMVIIQAIVAMGHFQNYYHRKCWRGGFKHTRDRNGMFEPIIIPKGETISSKIEDAIIGMYSRGMTTSDVRHQVLKFNDLRLVKQRFLILQKVSWSRPKNGNNEHWNRSILQYGWMALFSK